VPINKQINTAIKVGRLQSLLISLMDFLYLTVLADDNPYQIYYLCQSVYYERSSETRVTYQSKREFACKQLA